MRLAVLGAFPFPLPQGSQVYAWEQARALAAAGAEVTFLCYGRGDGRRVETAPGVTLRRAARALSPVPLRAGPALVKPLADAALLATVLDTLRGAHFDGILAHNAEAALVAFAARARTGVLVVYVAHTILADELGSYGPARLAGLASRAGGRLDRLLARRADALIALAERPAAALRPHARGPLGVIPPGLDPRPDPDPADVARTCARHGLAPERFALYAGNLDAYQDLDVLERVARALPETPVVVVTHAEGPARFRALRVARVRDPEEARRLGFGAGVCVLPRRHCGGFPIKLLNYMEARRAIVARAHVAEGLEHDRSAVLLDADAPPERFASAIRALRADPARAQRLGRGARAVLEARHGWPALAGRTLRLLDPIPRPTDRGGPTDGNP